MTPERLEEIKRWRKRVSVESLVDSPTSAVAGVLDAWLILVDELIEAVEAK